MVVYLSATVTHVSTTEFCMALADTTAAMFESPACRMSGPEGYAEYIMNLIGKYNTLAIQQLWNEDAGLRESARVATESSDDGGGGVK